MMNTEDMTVIVRHLRIHGRVQGVYYRQTMQEQAQALQVTGWVRNRHDGSVEAYACGKPAALDALVAWAEGGPPAARVDECVVSPAEADPALHDFTQAATA